MRVSPTRRRRRGGRWSSPCGRAVRSSRRTPWPEGVDDPQDPLAAHDVALVRADNPGPLTLSGTNTWLVGRDPCWVIDPGPLLAPHVDAVLAEARARGGIGGIALTHDHADHAESAEDLARRAGGVPVAAARWSGATVRLGGGDTFGPLRALPVPGHAPDHLTYAFGAACATGD